MISARLDDVMPTVFDNFSFRFIKVDRKFSLSRNTRTKVFFFYATGLLGEYAKRATSLSQI